MSFDSTDIMDVGISNEATPIKTPENRLKINKRNYKFFSLSLNMIIFSLYYMKYVLSISVYRS